MQVVNMSVASSAPVYTRFDQTISTLGCPQGPIHFIFLSLWKLDTIFFTFLCISRTRSLISFARVRVLAPIDRIFADRL